jgi:hypothetical protein
MNNLEFGSHSKILESTPAQSNCNIESLSSLYPYSTLLRRIRQIYLDLQKISSTESANLLLLSVSNLENRLKSEKNIHFDEQGQHAYERAIEILHIAAPTDSRAKSQYDFARLYLGFVKAKILIHNTLAQKPETEDIDHLLNALEVMEGATAKVSQEPKSFHSAHGSFNVGLEMFKKHISKIVDVHTRKIVANELVRLQEKYNSARNIALTLNNEKKAADEINKVLNRYKNQINILNGKMIPPYPVKVNTPNFYEGVKQLREKILKLTSSNFYDALCFMFNELVKEVNLYFEKRGYAQIEKISTGQTS